MSAGSGRNSAARGRMSARPSAGLWSILVPVPRAAPSRAPPSSAAGITCAAAELLLPLVGLGALGAIYVGSRSYTPYAYVDGPVGPTVPGPTEDGLCELRMTEVPLEDGGAELQCVAYCPQ